MYSYSGHEHPYTVPYVELSYYARFYVVLENHIVHVDDNNYDNNNKNRIVHHAHFIYPYRSTQYGGKKAFLIFFFIIIIYLPSLNCRVCFNNKYCRDDEMSRRSSGANGVFSFGGHHTQYHAAFVCIFNYHYCITYLIVGRSYSVITRHVDPRLITRSAI